MPIFAPTKGALMSDISIGGLPATAPFRVGVVLSKTFAVFGRQLGNFLLLTFVPLIPVLFFTLLRPAELPSGLPTSNVNLYGILGGILTFVLQMVAQATTLYGAFQEMSNQSFTISQSLKVGLRRALPLFAVALSAGLATGLATILLLVPGLIVLCMLYVAVPACVIEKLGVTASLNRSAALTKGHRWQIFGLVVLVSVVAAIVQYVLARVGGDGTLARLLNFAWLIVDTSFAAVLHAVTYHDLRVAKEGIDIDNLAKVFD
jgi:hypothetical protein